jgi:hypothetical protein
VQNVELLNVKLAVHIVTTGVQMVNIRISIDVEIITIKNVGLLY